MTTKTKIWDIKEPINNRYRTAKIAKFDYAWIGLRQALAEQVRIRQVGFHSENVTVKVK